MALRSGNSDIQLSDGTVAITSFTGATINITYMKISAIKIGGKDGGAILLGDSGLNSSNYGYAVKVGESVEFIFQTAVPLSDWFVRNPDAFDIKVAVIAA